MPLPIPPGTRPPRGRSMATLSVVLGVAFLAIGAVGVATGARRPGLMLGLGAFWLAMAVFYAPKDNAAVHTRDRALVLPVSRRRLVATYAGSACVGIGLASGQGAPEGFPLLTVWAVVSAVVMLRGGLGGSLLLDPDGVTYDVWRRRRRATWDEVTGVELTYLDMLMVDGLGKVRADRMEVDLLVVFWTLRYYRQNPESRAELADERAVDRVRREDLTGTPSVPLASGS